MKFALLPVKDPSQAKQRLAELLSPAQREQLTRCMFAEVLEQLMRVRGLDRVVVASSDAEVLRQATAAGATILEESAQSGHSDSADESARRCMEWGATSLLLVPLDVPCAVSVEMEELLEASAAMEPPSLVIVPDAEGTGTNAMVRTPPDLIASRFGPNSLRAHLAQAQAAGAAVRIVHPPGLVHDVDTPEDARTLLARGWSGRSGLLFQGFLNHA